MLDAKSSNSEFARSDSAAGMGLKEVIETVKPSILLGLTACPGLFDEGIVRAMASCNDRPIIFPLSNPTSRCEVSYEDALEWTDGRVILRRDLRSIQYGWEMVPCALQASATTCLFFQDLALARRSPNAG